MKKIFFTAVFIAVNLSSDAQAKCNISKAYAYFTMTIPGAQMVDENGNPVPPVPNVDRVIYLDWKGAGGPVVQSVSYNNISMTATITRIEGSTTLVGKKQVDQKDILVKVKKGNTIWKLQLQRVDDKPQEPGVCKNISIKIKTAGKICVYKVSGGESQLYTLPMY